MVSKLGQAWNSLPRNPRFAVITFVGLFLTISLYAWHQPSAFGRFSDKFTHYYESTAARDPLYGNLKATLEYQEIVYQDHIHRRQKLIEHWGGIDSITSFPTNGQFYTVWDFITPAFSCPFPVTRIGTLGDGGKWVCGFQRVVKQPECVIYSFGVERESSFEAEILDSSSSCKIYGYDFSVTQWGPQLRDNPAYASRIDFHPYKLGGVDDSSTTPPMHTLSGLMAMNGHHWVDILKVDIEGAEFDVFNSLLDAYEGHPLPFGQLQIEIHLWGKEFAEFLKWWERLEAAGLRPFWTEPNLPSINVLRSSPGVLEWSFMNTRGDHVLVKN